MKVAHWHLHDYQIVDWKSPREQLNSYDELQMFPLVAKADPFEALADTYPAEALEEMRAHYGLVAGGGGMKVMGRYLVSGRLRYREHPPGTEFEAYLDEAVEARAINRGSITLFERIPADLEPGSYRLPATRTTTAGKEVK